MKVLVSLTARELSVIRQCLELALDNSDLGTAEQEVCETLHVNLAEEQARAERIEARHE